MSKLISIFNQKGGVGKTTMAFHVGWALAEKGKSVLLVDADPQCGLTWQLSQSKKERSRYISSQLDQILGENKGLWRVFSSFPKQSKDIDCNPIYHNLNLSLMPGSSRLADFELDIGSLHRSTLSSISSALFSEFLFNYIRDAAQQNRIDYVILDLGPNLNQINRHLLMISDFFLVPVNPDCFAEITLHSMAKTLLEWRHWADQLTGISLPGTSHNRANRKQIKFLGTIINKFRVMNGNPTKAYQEWIDKINDFIEEYFLNSLDHAGLLLSKEFYDEAGLEKGKCLAQIADFNSPMASSQQSNLPVYSLTDKEVSVGYQPLDQFRELTKAYGGQFANVAEKVEILTSRSDQ